MEGLFIVIAVIVFIVRTVNKIKKAAGSSKKTGNIKSPKPSSAMDKLEKLIRSMEEAERLKKAGEEGTPADSIPPGPAMPGNESYSNIKVSVKKSSGGAAEDDNLSFSGNGKQSAFFNERIASGIDTARYEAAGNYTYSENEQPVNKEFAEEAPSREIFKKDLEDSSLSVINQSNSEVKSRMVYSGGGKGGILSSLSKYPELQRAVILKEIFDSPLSGRN